MIIHCTHIIGISFWNFTKKTKLSTSNYFIIDNLFINRVQFTVKLPNSQVHKTFFYSANAFPKTSCELVNFSIPTDFQVQKFSFLNNKIKPLLIFIFNPDKYIFILLYIFTSTRRKWKVKISKKVKKFVFITNIIKIFFKLENNTNSTLFCNFLQRFNFWYDTNYDFIKSDGWQTTVGDRFFDVEM